MVALRVAGFGLCFLGRPEFRGKDGINYLHFTLNASKFIFGLQFRLFPSHLLCLSST